MPIWILAIRLLIVALLVRRLWIDAIKASHRDIPATRLAVPVLILVSALLVANHIVPRPVAIAGLFAIDLLFLGLCLGLLRALRQSANRPALPEQRLESVLVRFFPPWFARLIGADITVLSHALSGLRAFLNPGRPDGHSYVQGSKIIIVGIIVAVSVIPDAFLFWLLLPHKLWWLAIILNVLDIWACLWFFGIYGTMVRRPHQWSQEKIVFSNGIMQSVEVSPEQIAQVHTIGIIKRHKLPRRRGDGSTVLGFGGVPLVEIVLSQPANELHLFLPKPREVRRLFVASDAPDAMCTELIRLSGSNRLTASAAV